MRRSGFQSKESVLKKFMEKEWMMWSFDSQEMISCVKGAASEIYIYGLVMVSTGIMKLRSESHGCVKFQN